MDNKLLYKVEEVGAQLSMSRSSIYQLIGKGEIATVKIGKSLRISSEALHDFVAKLSAREPD